MAEQPHPPGAPLLLSPDTTVRCPSCEREFSLEQGFAKKALEHLEQESRSALAQMRSLTEQALAPQLQALQAELAQSRSQLDRLAEREAALVARERGLDGEVSQAAGLKAQQLLAAERQALNQRIADQDAQLSALRAQQLELLRSKSALEDRAGQLELEVARRLDAGRAALETRIRAQEKERADLDKAELQKKLEDVNAKLLEAQQKGSQGSQQLQGEVLELMIEDQLRQAFPADVFEEVKKGARGADVVQRVMTRSQQPAGTILWEAKRAREWGRDWPAKLKEDMRAAGADVGILVTTSLPREMSAAQMFGLHEDVWVSSWSAAVPLASALRERVLEVHKHRAISAGKGEKMEALYDYLTSAQFAQKLKAIYGAFQAMQEDLQKERTIAEQRWARREKQISTGMKEVAGFAGDVQGLAQQSLPQLELQPDLPLDR